MHELGTAFPNESTQEHVGLPAKQSGPREGFGYLDLQAHQARQAHVTIVAEAQLWPWFVAFTHTLLPNECLFGLWLMTFVVQGPSQRGPSFCQ